MEREYKGNGVVGHIGVGKAKLVDCSCPKYEIRFINEIEERDRELGRFVRKLKQYCDNTRVQIEHVKNTIGKREAEILGSHIKMTHDLALQYSLLRKISDGICAEQATTEICDEYIERFLSADEDFVRQLATDVRDFKTCMINLLLNQNDVEVEHFETDTVVIAKELTPSVVARLDREHTKGIVTEIGSKNSHGAALVRAMKIPSVTGIVDIDKLIKENEIVTVNGKKGIVTVN